MHLRFKVGIIKNMQRRLAANCKTSTYCKKNLKLICVHYYYELTLNFPMLVLMRDKSTLHKTSINT